MNVTSKSPCIRLPIAAVLLCMTLAADAQADGTNTAPALWSFESMPPGTVVVDSNSVGITGWEGLAYSTSNNAAQVVALATNPPVPPNGYPLPSETHNNALQILGRVTAPFSPTTNVMIDCLVQAGFCEEPVAVPAGAQVAAYFNTNGHLVVRHANYTNNWDGMLNRQWTELNNTPVGTSDWVRLTVVMDYFGAGDNNTLREHFFKVILNGIQLTSPLAYTNLPLTYYGMAEAEDDGDYPLSGVPGTSNVWFLCADSGYGSVTDLANQPNNRYFSAVEFDGAGIVDDLVVTNLPSSGGVVANCDWSTYEGWLACWPTLPSGEQDPGDDWDHDGASNYKEWVSGTSPIDANDSFRVVRERYMGASNLVMWVGSTNNPHYTTYTMWRSTNLVNSAGWVAVASNLSRSATGTNTWYDTNLPAGTRAFYQPVIPTNAP